MAAQGEPDQTIYQAFAVTADGFDDLDQMALYFVTGNPIVDVTIDDPTRVDRDPGRLIVADIDQGGEVTSSVAAAMTLGDGSDRLSDRRDLPPGGWDDERDDFERIVRSFRTDVPPDWRRSPWTVRPPDRIGIPLSREVTVARLTRSILGRAVWIGASLRWTGARSPVRWAQTRGRESWTGSRSNGQGSRILAASTNERERPGSSFTSRSRRRRHVSGGVSSSPGIVDTTPCPFKSSRLAPGPNSVNVGAAHAKRPSWFEVAYPGPHPLMEAFRSFGGGNSTGGSDLSIRLGNGR